MDVNSNDIVHYKGYAIGVYNAESSVAFLDSGNCRPGMGNLGTMICFHKRYSLGHVQDLKSDMFNSWDELEKYVKRKKRATVMLPIYLYDHSGLVISTHSFSCPWDSGRLGLIYTTASRINHILGYRKKNTDNAERLVTAEQRLIEEVEQYNCWLSNDIWYFTILDDDEIMVVDTSDLYYGSTYDSIVADAKASIDCYTY